MIFLTQTDNYKEIIDLAETYKLCCLTNSYNVSERTYLYLHDPYIYLSEVLSLDAYPLSESSFIKKIVTHEDRLKQKHKALLRVDRFPVNIKFADRKEVMFYL